MKRTILVTIFFVLSSAFIIADTESDPMREILVLEHKAMDGWLAGNPDPSLANLDSSITYFHFPIEKRLNGIAAVKEFFEPYRGKPLFDSYEIVDPALQTHADLAVLTYQLVTHNGSATGRWNCSEVYRHDKLGWKVIHAHWSRVNSPSVQR